MRCGLLRCSIDRPRDSLIFGAQYRQLQHGVGGGRPSVANEPRSLDGRIHAEDQGRHQQCSTQDQCGPIVIVDDQVSGELQERTCVRMGALAPTDEPPPRTRPTANADCWEQWLQPRTGLVAELGSFRFDAVDIIGFARTYDPQPFHVDEEAARTSVFGRLCASGLHSLVVWAVLAQHGPWDLPVDKMSDLNWRRPIFAGETIRFRSTIRSLGPSDKLPHSNRLQRLNEALDSTGAVVMHFGDEVVMRTR